MCYNSWWEEQLFKPSFSHKYLAYNTSSFCLQQATRGAIKSSHTPHIIMAHGTQKFVWNNNKQASQSDWYQGEESLTTRGNHVRMSSFGGQWSENEGLHFDFAVCLALPAVPTVSKQTHSCWQHHKITFMFVCYHIRTNHRTFFASSLSPHQTQPLSRLLPVQLL